MFDVLLAVEQRVYRSEFEDTIKVLWSIWENRNRKWNQLPSMNGQQLLNWVFNAYPKVTTVDPMVVQKKADAPPNLKHWIPPESGCICVNSDATIKDNAVGVGLGLCSIKMAEAWALLEALKKPPAADTSQIAVQTDCRLLVEEIKGNA
ncbi:hypothetical protein G4B88_013111 [Cannabis sativa]|uniref:RNase H type-1 domain-containing protein n=1 Tax=Cannabis sativa TaxID=3483 RepID=A0A7J6I2Q0_CANSA|nr:hypothetical protein G4B88_013111 [Cannabis sativa]